MSKSDARGDHVEDDCPLCLEPLPPFWDERGRKTNLCCGRSMCIDCWDKQTAFLERAIAEGSFGRQEKQLARCCPLCRTRRPTDDDVGALLMEKFEKGQLPLNFHDNLGKFLIDGQGGLKRHVERGSEIWMAGAEKGDPCCQFLIGAGYQEGNGGLPRSPSEAKKWLAAATEQGHAIAEFNLGIIMRDEGNGVEYIRHMRGSAAKGYNEACFVLGIVYNKGKYGLQQSKEEAVRVLTPAAERGHAGSMGLLGSIMCKPDPQLPPPPDNPNFTKGVHWLRRAANKGDDAAISNLGNLEKFCTKICFVCDKDTLPGRDFLRCSRCRAAWYCSKDCQRRHWKAKEMGHKQFCIKWE